VRPGLGEKFLAQLQLAYDSISMYPTNFGFIDDRKILRDKLLKVFPYTIIYAIEEETVIVVDSTQLLSASWQKVPARLIVGHRSFW